MIEHCSPIEMHWVSNWNCLVKNHTHIADLYYNIGITYGLQVNTDEELKHEQFALKIYEKDLHTDHLNCASVISNIGSSYQDNHDLDQATSLYQKALEIKQIDNINDES